MREREREGGRGMMSVREGESEGERGKERGGEVERERERMRKREDEREGVEHNSYRRTPVICPCVHQW